MTPRCAGLRPSAYSAPSPPGGSLTHRIAFGLFASAFVTIACLSRPAQAHPGSGFVVDRAGTVYFVVYGTSRIMRVTRDGTSSVLVDDERLRLPHHLVLDAAGALYSASDFNGKVWRVGSDGSLHLYFNSDLLPRSAPGFRTFAVGQGGDPFTLDAAGNIYALGPGDRSNIVRITPESRVTPVAAGARFGDLHFSSMAWSPAGDLYVSDETRIWRISADTAVVISPHGGALQRAAGLAVDAAGNIYVADYFGGRLVRLTPDGTIDTPPALRRLRAQHPIGVALLGDEVYILDAPPRAIAVWRVRDGKAERLFSQRDPSAYAAAALLLLLPGLMVLQTWRRRPTGWGDWSFWFVPSAALVGGLYWIRIPGDVLIVGSIRHLIAFLLVVGAWRSGRGLRRRALLSPAIDPK